MIRNILMIGMLAAAATFSSIGEATADPACNTDYNYSETDTPSYTRRVVLSETDNYIDLRTGNVIRIHWDAANNNYVREDLAPLEIYVNSVSRDTFYGPQAVLVNNALVHDAAGYYAVDPNWVNPNGDGFKAKSADGEMKIKDNENELKIKDGNAKIKDNENELKMKEGDAKVKSNENELKVKDGNAKLKSNENEYKRKDGDAKVKENENELKMKSGDAKMKSNSNEQKYKTADGAKVKSNDKETKVKTDDGKTKVNNRTGEVKTKSK